jgi:hypothetical protein
MLYFTLNQRHGEIFRIFDRTDLKIIRVKLFLFFFLATCPNVFVHFEIQ